MWFIQTSHQFFFINSSIRSLSLIRPASLFMPPWSMFHHVVPISCCWKKLQCVPLVSIESFSQHLVAGSHLSRKNFHTFHPCSHFYQRNVTGTLLIDPYIDGIFDEKHLQTHRFSHGFSHGFPHHGPRRCTWTAGNRCWITGWRPCWQVEMAGLDTKLETNSGLVWISTMVSTC